MKHDQVEEWMRQLAESPVSEAQLPNPHTVWWMAQALRRLDEQRECAAALEKADRFQLVCATVAAMAMAIWILVAEPESRIASIVSVTFLVGAALTAGVFALATLSARRNGDARVALKA